MQTKIKDSVKRLSIPYIKIFVSSFEYNLNPINRKCKTKGSY